MIPKYVYHYTSIETLKEIIITKNIRFTRLDKLNDPYEGLIESEDETMSIKEIRKRVYCSCWTNTPQENLSLWAMYTDMKGIRIKMKSTLFADHLRLTEQNTGFMPIETISPIKIRVATYDIHDSVIDVVYGPFKVDYVETLQDTYSSATLVFDNADNGTQTYNVFPTELGLKKVNHWEYENEWRYKISVPGNIAGLPIALSNIPTSITTTPEYIDIPYITEIEEILVGPQVTEEEIIELREFLKVHNIRLEIQKSLIKINPKKS